MSTTYPALPVVPELSLPWIRCIAPASDVKTRGSMLVVNRDCGCADVVNYYDEGSIMTTPLMLFCEVCCAFNGNRCETCEGPLCPPEWRQCFKCFTAALHAVDRSTR